MAKSQKRYLVLLGFGLLVIIAAGVWMVFGRKTPRITVIPLNRKDCKYFIIPAKKPMPPFLSPTDKYAPAESALMFPLILFPVSVLRNI